MEIWWIVVIAGIIILYCISHIHNIRKDLQHHNHTIRDLNRDKKQLLAQLDDINKQYDELHRKKDNLDVQFIFQLDNKKKQFEEFQREKVNLDAQLNLQLDELRKRLDTLQKDNDRLITEQNYHKKKLSEFLESNLTSIPFLAGMIADYLTYDLEILAKKLDWGHDRERLKKVKTIREIRADAKARIEQAKIAIYQLDYLKTIFPGLEDALETDYRELTFTGEIPEHDPIRDYLSREEWESLSESEKSQRALDNYVASHKKSKWQIGRDYELYVGYMYQKKGYTVDYTGSYMGLEDLGRDLIAQKNNKILIVQCKYWSESKQIHEKHLFQLYGTLISYSLERDVDQNDLQAVFVTNIQLSNMARQIAQRLNIAVKENYKIDEFPRIKCNIGRDEYGFEAKIYHLPMDQQYDSVKICKEGEFFAFTVEEAEAYGFRRAFRWHGN